MTAPPPPLPSRRQPDWWQRNWKWVVPGFVVISVAAIGLFALMVMQSLKTSGAYAQAVEQAQTHARLIEALGAPIEEGRFFTGTVNLSGRGGDAQLAIPLQGPNGGATLQVRAVREDGVWHFNRLDAELKDEPVVINLLEP